MTVQPPAIKKVMSCGSGYGGGGMGQHFARVVEQTRAAGQLGRYYAGRIRPGDEVLAERVSSRLMPWLMRYTPVRFSPGWSAHLSGDLFDSAVARKLRAPIECFVGISGQSLASFERAGALGCRRFEVLSPTSHVRNVARLNRIACEMYPIESSWLNRAQFNKSLREYEMADVIYVSSEYSRRTFLAEGVAAEKLQRLDYPVDPRFVPPKQPPDHGTFHIVYCGAVTVTKGVPVLLDAFARLDHPRARLTLVGGTSTRPMNRYVMDRLRRDPRISMAAGDPLPHLHTAHVYVHPSFQDGLGYAPLEAMACGVFVIVSEDTGMKEYVKSAERGYIVPTGSVDALVDALMSVAKAAAPRAVGERKPQ